MELPLCYYYYYIEYIVILKVFKYFKYFKCLKESERPDAKQANGKKRQSVAGKDF